MPTLKSTSKGRQFARKRERVRNAIWANCELAVWSRLHNDGFTTIPRIIPLIGVLLRTLAKKGNPYLAYLDLWARVYDEGFVEIRDEEDCAFSSGYTGERAIRTWRERISNLEKLGFVQTQPKGNRPFGYVLIINPLLVAAKLRYEGSITDEWWNSFVARVEEIGAEIPTEDDVKESMPSQSIDD